MADRGSMDLAGRDRCWGVAGAFALPKLKKLLGATGLVAGGH